MSRSRRNVPQRAVVLVTVDDEDGQDDEVRIVATRNGQSRGRGRSRVETRSRPELIVLSDDDETDEERSRSPILGRRNRLQRVVRLGARQQRPVLLPSRNRTENTRPTAVVRPTVRRNASRSSSVSSVRSWDPYDPATDDDYDDNYDDDETIDFVHGENIPLFVG